MRKFIIILIISIIVFNITYVRANENTRPTGLTINLLNHADRVFLNGYPVNVPLYQAVKRNENFQFTEIAQKKPFLGWIVHSEKKNTLQTAYQILVSSSPDSIEKNIGNVWNSGKVRSNQSINIKYSGKPLIPDTVYFWKVKTWNNHGEESPFSDVSQFKTCSVFVDYGTARYPLQKQDEFPVLVKTMPDLLTFVDFGRAAFGRLRLTLFGTMGTDTVIIHFGEAVKDGRIDRQPGGTIRYASYKLPLLQGWNTYIICIPPDKRNTRARAIRMPEYIGEVLPFRYCEIDGYAGPFEENQFIRETVFYPFNEEESSFTSSDSILNQIWDLCKYSVKATSFAGVYVDGDRERIPYEADALINQLSHYGVAREYSIARYSHEYLINKPTWPTEWIMQSVLMAWNDYLYTENMESLSHFYNDLKHKTLIALADEDGFISTRTGKVNQEVLQSIHFNGELKDIVDWPHPGILGLGENEGGETDGFVFRDVNTVVNAYHYQALVVMEKIAGLLDEKVDRQWFLNQAEKLKKSFNEKLLDKKKGLYTDGIGTSHASLHANIFPLVFGLPPENNRNKILDFIRSKNMACSIYGSLVLLSALYDNGYADYALELLRSTSERSWHNMIRIGSTITLEAWDNKFKPNQDWNHAAGAAPAYIIPAKLMGIEPEEPAFRKIRIKPQPADLEYAKIKYPTIRGAVQVSFQNKPGESFSLVTNIPANTIADIYLPLISIGQEVFMNGQKAKGIIQGNFYKINNIGSGENRFEVRR